MTQLSQIETTTFYKDQYEQILKMINKTNIASPPANLTNAIISTFLTSSSLMSLLLLQDP